MIAIIDYKAGNIFSVKNALDYLGLECCLTSDADRIISADALILPGVGAFPPAMKMLNDSGLTSVILSEAVKKPFLGICLGMQLLFERSFEFGDNRGLGLIPGYVGKIDETGLVVPHMGWNRLEILRKSPLLDESEYVYFVHSYKAFCSDENVIAYCEYGSRVPALVTDGKTVFGAQFHPEKSGAAGLEILRRFGELI